MTKPTVEEMKVEGTVQMCPIMIGKVCLHDEVCDEHCLEFLSVCDGCDAPGNNESDGLTLHDDGRTLCHLCEAKEPAPSTTQRER